MKSILLTLTTLAISSWVVFGNFTTPYNELTTVGDEDLDREEQARKNVTQLLDNVLHGYNKNVRPNAGVEPTTVKVDIFILSLGPVIDLDMEFYVEVFFRQRWSDPRLNYNNSNQMNFKVLSLNTIMLESIWYPDTYIYNGKKSKSHSITTPNRLFRIFPNGDILYTQRLTIVAACPMQFQKYPMDSQNCSVIVGSNTYSVEDVVYKWKHSDNLKDSVAISDDIRLSQYALITWDAFENIKVSDRIGNRTLLKVTFVLKRNLGNFLIQTYLPCSMVVILSWISFFLNREATPARVSLGIMTILSITTLGWNSRTQLPKVHYANAIDYYVLLCFGFTFAAVCEFASVNYFTKRRAGMMPGMQDDEEDDMLQAQVEQVEETLKKRKKRHKSSFSFFRGISRDRSRGTRRLLNSTPNKTHCDDGASDEDDTNCCGDIVNCLSGNAENRRQRFKRTAKDGKTFNSVSKIDEMSRIIFPVTFSLANALFWCIYYIF
ncbi:gamma-aminobutyric acid receptor subunit alpha-2-like isoform X2 [Apostichopus japonicus]|uniref:gamma-aminobutyric acid receptor subunit alpha-2-like isoform X2 n=1 Tax=Stichopus japonicus TaxID=307972 RepID=UPI003AB497E9